MSLPDERAASPTDSLISENHISEDEWDVDDLLAERVMKGDKLGRPAGERCWLVKWTGYPLGQATWEPREHFQEELLKSWEDEKEKHLAGTKKPFKVREWKKAYLRYWKDRVQDQELRNKRRLEAGKQQQPVDDLEAIRLSLKSVDSEDDSDEDVDWAALDHNAEDDYHSDSSTESLAESLPSSYETDFEVRHIRHRSGLTETRRSSQDGQRTTEDFSAARKSKKMLSKERGLATHKKHGAEDTTFVHNKCGQQKAPGRTQACPPRNDNQLSKHKLSKQPHAPTEVSRSVSPQPASTFGLRKPSSSLDLRAIKTRKPPHPEEAVNVFVGGKEVKKRSPLERAVETSAADPKMLNWRYQRLIQKRLRDNEGTRDPRPAQKRTLGNQSLDFTREESSLFVTPDADGRPRTSPSSDPQGSKCGTESSHAGTPEAQNNDPVPVIQHQVEVEVLGLSSAAPHEVVSETNSGLKRKKKAVAFMDDHSEPMDTDTNQSHIVPANGDPTQEAEFDITPRDVTKTCKVGLNTAKELSVTFQALSREVLTSHLSEFENLPMLHFTHQCSEEDFVFFRAAIQANVIAEGYVRGERSSNALHCINERLRAHRQALLCHMTDLCVLLVPNASPTKNSEASKSNMAGHSEEPAFVIFRPVDTFEPPMLNTSDLETSLLAHRRPQGASLDMDRLLRFEYGRLLPANHADRMHFPFFMLFPPALEHECFLLAQWLRQCNPACIVLSSILPGHWSIFRSYLTGVVVVHQDSLEMVRLLPGLGDILRSPDSTKNFSFWTLGTTPRQNHSVLEDDVAEDQQYTEAQPICLSPLLPAGTVFFITPSFLLAQPEPAYIFLKWFSKNFVEAPRPEGPVCKLALCGNTELWFTELLDEKASSRAKQDDEKAWPGNERNVRMKTRHLVTKLLSQNDLDDEDLFSNPLVVAPTNIDGNDEQSLVNWFTWWAATHMNMFRYFEVIGTSDSDRSRLTRRVGAPRYQGSSIIDPGALFDEVNIPIPDAHTSLPTPIVLRDAIAEMQQGLRSIEERLSSMPLAILFRKPVSYFAPGMAVNLGDTDSRFVSFDQWFTFFHALHEIKGTRNTYIGFFYTLEGDWDPDAHPADVAPPCHPWFAIFRPQNPSRKPWISTELFIWDSTLSQKCSISNEIFESDLIPAQRALISIVANRNDEINRGAPLRQVWCGGFESADQSSTPLRHTLDRLAHLVENLRSDLDARSDRLPRCGWKAVQYGARPGSDHLRPAVSKLQGPTHFTIGESDNERDGADRKMVFHPPKGDKALYSRQIENRLLKAAQKAKDEGQTDTFDFSFATTQEWYDQLKTSRRQSEHIRVVQWATIFRELEVR